MYDATDVHCYSPADFTASIIANREDIALTTGSIGTSAHPVTMSQMRRNRALANVDRVCVTRVTWGDMAYIHLSRCIKSPGKGTENCEKSGNCQYFAKFVHS
jgi:hypothetical protein